MPYANTFVAGDNLFRDFHVDFSEEAVQTNPVGDQHIFLNTSDVAVFGQTKVACLTCHDVHRQSSAKHQQLADSAICLSCHVPGTDNTKLLDTLLPANRQRDHSRVCDY